MKSLSDVLGKLGEADKEMLEKQAAADKIAEDEEYAGRITARGFADEFQKLAGFGDASTAPPQSETVKSKPGLGTNVAPAGKMPGMAPHQAAAPKPASAPGAAGGVVAKGDSMTPKAGGATTTTAGMKPPR